MLSLRNCIPKRRAKHGMAGSARVFDRSFNIYFIYHFLMQRITTSINLALLCVIFAGSHKPNGMLPETT